MEKQSKTKITWEIKNFSLAVSEKIYSDEFVVGGCKWRLCALNSLSYLGYLSYYLEVADYRSLPSGWGRHARYLIYPVNLNSATHTEQNEGLKWFDQNSPNCFILSRYRLNEIGDKDGGFLVNGMLKIVAEIEVLQIIGKLDVTETTLTIVEDVNGFQLQSSQVELATHMFERHPEIASELRTKNPNLRTGCMSLLLSLIEALRHSPHELLKADLAVARDLLGFMTDAGFKLDWLEKILDEISEKKEKEEAGETRMQEIEDEMKDLKKKYSDLEAELKKEKAQAAAEAKGLNPGLIVLLVIGGPLVVFLIANCVLYVYAQKNLPPKKKKPVSKKKLKREKLKQGVPVPGE